MLISFLPIVDKNNIQAMPSLLDYTELLQSTQSVTTSKVWMATYVPMLFANAPNLASKCASLCVDCKGISKLEVAELHLVLLFVELPDRFGYLALYNKQEKKLLYLAYIGEITLMLSVKTIFTEYKYMPNTGLKNICMVAPIDSIITAEEPYRSEYNALKTAFVLSSHSYVYLNGSILKCKRIGRQGRDLQVVDKFFVTNKIPELNKALSHEPTCLINGKLVADSLIGDDANTVQRLLDRMRGKSLPVARFGISIALSDLHNDADIIVALAKTKDNDAICAHLSNDWLKRAVKHKLNKFPPEYSSDGKYEVQQLTTEATIKYQGGSWKGAEKSDLVYTVVEKASRKPLAIISIGAIELEYIKKRSHTIKSALNNGKTLAREVTLEFETSGISKALLVDVIDFYKTHMKLANSAALRTFVLEYPNNTVSWLDFFQKEAELATKCPKQTVSILAEILLKGPSTAHDHEVMLFIDTKEAPGKIITTLKPAAQHFFTLKTKFVTAKPHDFNFPLLAIKVPGANGNQQVYMGRVKFNVALLKNINEPADNILLYTRSMEHAGVGTWAYNSFSLCDYLFPTMPLHENASYGHSVENGYQLVVSNAIYGKKFKDAAKIMRATGVTDFSIPLATIAKLVSTGIEIPGTQLSSALSLGYVPDTYSEYLELCSYDDKFNAVADKHQTVMYTEPSCDDDSLLDGMDDDDYSDLLDDEYTDDDYSDLLDDEYTDDDDMLDASSDILDDDEEADVWEMQRILWLQTHSNSTYITDNNERVYWFDIVHSMMIADQPESANNIQLLETVWSSMLSKMQGYTAQDVMSMMYEQIKGVDNTSSEDTASTESPSDLTDDDDDLFADL